MRVPILTACVLLLVNPLHADVLSDSDRETLLETLDKLRDTAESRADARFQLALAAYRSAMATDTAVFELYLNCVEKVDFQEQSKKAGDFREWKRTEAEKHADPALRLALRHQLRWLVLTLRATSENADKPKLAVEAQQAVDAVFADFKQLKTQQDLLNQAVTETVFARAYETDGIKIENWPLSPIQLEQIYEKILLPPHRTPDHLNELRNTWIKRIQQESIKADTPAGNDRGDAQGQNDTQSPEQLKFAMETLPRLQWDMEVDLFLHGDQSAAAMRMLKHLEKYINHESAREWSDEFKKLLTPAPATGTVDP